MIQTVHCLKTRLCVQCAHLESRSRAHLESKSRAHYALSCALIREQLLCHGGCDLKQANPGRDLKTGSRHRFSCPTPSQVVTPKPGRNPSWRLTYVATLILCRDLISAHSGISRPRHQNPSRKLPHCHPCRDTKTMLRPQISPAPSLLCRDAIFPCRQALRLVAA